MVFLFSLAMQDSSSNLEYCQMTVSHISLTKSKSMNLSLTSSFMELSSQVNMTSSSLSHQRKCALVSLGLEFVRFPSNFLGQSTLSTNCRQ